MTDPLKLTFGEGQSAPRPNHCGGAVLHVDRDMYREYERGGVRWSTRSKELALDGRSHARVQCADEVMAKNGEFGMVVYGLCASCSALELRHREVLRRQQGGGQ